MKIDRMKEGQLYEIKQGTVIEASNTGASNPEFVYPVLKGWRKWDHNQDRPPFIYLGYKYEDWKYNYQNTSKVHYVLWKEEIYVMDNQFAKHVIPVWDGEKENG